MSDPAHITSDQHKPVKKLKYIPVADKSINKLSALMSQELYGTFDVPFVHGFSMLLRAVSSIKAKELNEE